MNGLMNGEGAAVTAPISSNTTTVGGAGSVPLAPGKAVDALRFRTELGLALIPVDGETKKPRMKRWQLGGLRAEESIVKVFGRFADQAVVGIPCGQRIEAGYLLVLDVDERNGGYEALEALPWLPETVTAKTKGGWHYWFATETPHPTVYRPDGLELKGAGSYVVVPPAPGRHWVRDPFEFQIAQAPDWLLAYPEPTVEPVQMFVDDVTGEVAVDLSDPVELVRRAQPGNRHRTLLVQGGRIAVRTRGTTLEADARGRLAAAARETGLEESEITRILGYVFRSPSSLPGGKQARRSNSCCHTLSDRELAVLAVVVMEFRRRMEASGLPFENHMADIFSMRWLAGQAGLSHPQQAKRVVDKLIGLGLLWRSWSSKRLRDGQRPCFRYRPTYAGMALIGGAS